MAEWAPKRFWKAAGFAPMAGGYAVTLDGRGVKTPAKAALVVPTEAMAAAIAAEWDAQEQVIAPETMPTTRAANSAIDKLKDQREVVIDMLAEYGGSDLLCYRAEGPQALIARQAEQWDPLLDWAETTLAAPLVQTAGIIHAVQNPASLAALRAEIAALDNFRLTAFHDLVAISGSLVLALAVVHGRLSADAAWTVSRLDEHWQAEQWGADEEALAIELRKRADFLQAHRFLGLCG